MSSKYEDTEIKVRRETLLTGNSNIELTDEGDKDVPYECKSDQITMYCLVVLVKEVYRFYINEY